MIGHGSKRAGKMRHYPVDFAFIPNRFKEKFDKSCVCSFQYDLAVVRIIQAVAVNSLDALPTLNRHPLKPFLRTYLYGWGMTEDDTYADELRRAKFLITSSISGWPTERKELMYSYDIEMSGEVGDSGGPWMSLDNSRLYGIHVGQTPPYGVAVKISYYANWILYVMYEYRDLLPNRLPSDRIIRCCGQINETVYHARGSIVAPGG